MASVLEQPEHLGSGRTGGGIPVTEHHARLRLACGVWAQCMVRCVMGMTVNQGRGVGLGQPCVAQGVVGIRIALT